MLALGTTTELWVLVLAAFVGGMGVEIFGIGWNLAIQENVSEGLPARVYSYDMLGSYIAIPVGEPTFDFRPMLLTAGIAFAVVRFLTLLPRPVRNLRRVSSADGPAVGTAAGTPPAAEEQGTSGAAESVS